MELTNARLSSPDRCDRLMFVGCLHIKGAWIYWLLPSQRAASDRVVVVSLSLPINLPHVAAVAGYASSSSSAAPRSTQVDCGSFVRRPMA